MPVLDIDDNKTSQLLKFYNSAKHRIRFGVTSVPGHSINGGYLSVTRTLFCSQHALPNDVVSSCKELAPKKDYLAQGQV